MRILLGLVVVVGVGGLVGCGDDGGPRNAPDTVLDSSPKALTNQTKVSFTFHATSPANGFVCSVDGQTPSECLSGIEITVGEGSHTFEVSAALNTLTDETPAMATWKVDATPPDTQLVMGPPALDNTVMPAIDFTGSDPGGGPVTFECKLDAADFAPCTAPSMLGVADGAHAFSVRAIDAAGNLDPSPASHQWTVDSSTPDTMITLGPTGGSTTTPDVTFTFGSPASGVTFECSLDGGAFVACTAPQTYTNLPDGMHTFTVRAKSAAGTMDPTPATRTWTVDGTAPDVMITTKPAAVSGDNTPTFGFTSADATAVFECAIDSGAFAACTSAFTSAVLADGMHTFRVRAKDPTGNTSTVATYAWTIDTMAPAVTITGGPSGMVASASASFTFTTTGSPTTVECALDGAAFAACTSPKAYTAVPDGMHAFVVRVSDAAGNAAMDMRAFTVDTVAPTVMITSAPTNPTNDNTPTFTFVTGGAPTAVACSLDGAAFAACTSPLTTAALADGSHTFVVRATDAVGNQASDTRTFSVDTAAPTVTIINKPSNPSTVATASFTFTVSEGSPTCSLDGGAFAACTSPRNYTALAEGSHTFTVRSADALGNTAMASYTWTIDTVAPVVTILTKPTNPSKVPTASFTFMASEGTVECQLDGSAFAACTSPKSYVGLADGSHTFTVRATDAAGNVGSAAWTWTIDTVPPTVVITAPKPANPTKLTTASFTFTASDGTIECQLDGGAFAACASPKAYTGLAAGSHTFVVRSTDAATNVGSDTWTWVVDTTAPTVVITTPKPANPTKLTTASFTFTVSDGTIECQLDGGAFAACASPKAYTGLAPGSHTFVVRSTDAATNVGSDSWTWVVDTTPPSVVINTKPANPTKLTSASFAFTVSDGTIECQLDGGAFAACASPKAYTGLTAGSHTFVVRSTDAATNVGSDTWTWVIDNTPPSVVINTKPANPTNQTGASFTFTVSDGTIECQLDGGAFAACASPKAYTGLAAGSHTFVVRSTDAATNVGSDTWTWLIDLTAPTVSITGPANPTASRNATLTFSVSEGSPQCKLDTGTFAPCTSPVNYTMLGDGSHTFSVQTTDAAGNPGSGSYTWVIDGTGPVVTFSSVPPARWPVNYYDFAWSANESATYECSVNGGASWVACATPFAIPNAATMLPAATYGQNNTFSVRGKDSLGNVGAAATASWNPTPGLVLHYPFEQGLRQNTSLLAQRPALSPGLSGRGVAVGGWAGTALRSAAAMVFPATARPLTSSPSGVYMGGMWIRVFSDVDQGTLWSNIDAGGRWGHRMEIRGITLTLTVLTNGVAQTATAQVPFGVWAHVGVRTTGAGKGLQIIVNGVPTSAVATTTGFEAGQGDLTIGNVAFVDIDDVRFYNTLVDPCTTFVRGEIPPTGAQCIANAPALELDFEGGRLDESGTMSIGRTNPLWTAFAGRLGDGFKMNAQTPPVTPLQMTNFAQQSPLLGHSLSLWVPGAGASDTLFDFTTVCSFAANLGTCGMGVVWTDNKQFRIFAGVPGLGSTTQQQITVPASPLSTTQTHNLVITEQRTANGTQSLRFYVDGRLEGTMSYPGGDVFATVSDTIRSCTNTGCSVDEIELWPKDLSANAEMLCENGFDGQWDPATDRCIFTSND